MKEIKKRTNSDRQNIINEYKSIIAYDSVKARNLIKKLDFKNDAFLLQCIAQTFLDEARFDEKGNQREFLNWRKWRVAERYIIKAYKIDPICPMVITTMGSVRRSGEQEDLAIYCFEMLSKMTLKKASEASCKLEKWLVKEIINDSNFELYRLYYYENPKLSKKYLEKYKMGLKKGASTIYSPLKQFLIK